MMRYFALACYVLAAGSAVLIIGGAYEERWGPIAGGPQTVSLGELWWSAFALLVGLGIQYGPRVWRWCVARLDRYDDRDP